MRREGDHVQRDEILHTPIQPIDVEAATGIGDLIQSYGHGSFQGRNLAECVDVYKAMLGVEKNVILLGLSGAMVPAGMRRLISMMVRRKMVDVVVSTGANLYHDYYEALGFRHYKGHVHADDTALEKLDIDRVYDTYLDDRAATDIDRKVGEVAAEMPPGRYSTRAFFDHLGSTIDDADSIIRTCYVEKTPLFCPTFHDSGFGIGITDHYQQCKKEGRDGFVLDLIRDNYEIMQIGLQSTESGVVIIGGGVPKNYIQQIAPMQEVLGIVKRPYRFAIQITTDDPKWGGLSGCTFSESHSWGKYTEDARTAVAYVDATIGLPLLAGGVLQTAADVLEARAKRRFFYTDDELSDLKFGE